MNTPLRILVILPLYGGSLPVGRYCAQALRDLGHLVEVFEAPAYHQSFTALRELRVTADRLETLENGFLNVLSQAIYAKVETFEPDLVLSMAQAPLNRPTLRRLRKDGVCTALWFVEDAALFTYWKAFAPAYDIFAVIQRDPLLNDLAALGVTALYLPMAALPSFHRPLELGTVERRRFGSELSFLGAGYPNRRLAFRQFTDMDFKIWGSDWEGETVLARHIQGQGARVSSEDSVKIFNASTINLNLHSSVHTKELVSRGDFVNPRTFEVAACGAFQLVDERSLLPELFAPDEMATFTSLPELKDRIRHFLAHPEERAAFAAKGRARVLAEHSYARRMSQLLDFIATQRPGWPAPRVDKLPASLPPELRAELAALLQRLGLPADTPFDDVMARLRQNSGKLTGLETSLLFLQEWNKLYRH